MTLHEIPRGATPPPDAVARCTSGHDGPVYWLALADLAVPELAIMLLAAACGAEPAEELPAAAWYDAERVAAITAGVVQALAAQQALVVLELGDTEPLASRDERWRGFLAPIMDAVPTVVADADVIERRAGEAVALRAIPAERRVAELQARWDHVADEPLLTRAVTLTRLVRVAIAAGVAPWAAEVLAGPSAAALRRGASALVERLAAETLRAGLPSPVASLVLASLRASHWYEIGNVATAIELYRAAVGIARRTGDAHLICHALNNLGNAVAAVDGAAAEAAFTEAISLARRHDLADEELINLNNLCVTLVEAGELDRAGECFDYALRRIDETRRWDSFGNVILGNLGTYYGADQPDLATTFLERAMQVAAARGDDAIHAAWQARLDDVRRRAAGAPS
jgi:tetratricopeptide (TPR) repeat protein